MRRGWTPGRAPQFSVKGLEGGGSKTWRLGGGWLGQYRGGGRFTSLPEQQEVQAGGAGEPRSKKSRATGREVRREKLLPLRRLRPVLGPSWRGCRVHRFSQRRACRADAARRRGRETRAVRKTDGPHSRRLPPHGGGMQSEPGWLDDCLSQVL